MSLPNNLPGPPGEFRGNHRRATGGSPGLAREKVAGADLSPFAPRPSRPEVAQ